MMPVMRPNREDLEMQMAGATATTAPLNSYADTLGGNDSISLSDTIADAPINVLLVEDDEGDVLERLWNIEWKSNLSRVALERVKNKVSPKQYQIFDAYVLKDWDATKVRKQLGVSMAQVYLAKHRVGGLVKKEIDALLGQFE